MKKQYRHQWQGFPKAILLGLLLIWTTSAVVQAQISIDDWEDVTCNGDEDGSATVTVQGGTTPYEYLWSDGQTSATASGLGAGSYTCTVTDANGCTGSDDVTISEPPPITISVSGGGGNIQFCIQDGPPTITLSASASGGTGAITYSWPGGSIDVSSSGTYTCTATDENGCSESASATVVFIPIVCSRDPNDIIGPEGYGDPKWVSVNEVLPYKIRFENDPEFATAPAQKVFINHPIDDHINIFSLRLSDFGFANFIFQVPANSIFYTDRIDLVDSLGVFVDVTAGLDVTRREAFWIFESVDPITGLQPTDPQAGLLPVNDTITHAGEGFVTFTVQPTPTAQTGDTIHAIADIIFDINEVIETPEIYNVIDAFAPTSSVDSMAAAADTNVITLTWTSADDPGGCGVAHHDLYVSEDGFIFNQYQAALPGNSYEFHGITGRTYSFFTLATDNVGNREPMKYAAEVEVTLGKDSLKIVEPVAGQNYCSGESITVSWEGGGSDVVIVSLSSNGGLTFVPLGSAPFTDSSATFTLPTSAIVSVDYVLAIVDSVDSELGDTSGIITVHPLPNADAGTDVSACPGSGAQLQATGGAIYEWTPGTGLSDSTISNPLANPAVLTVYTVKVTDANSCVATDTVVVDIADTTSPTATCPANVTMQSDVGQCGAVLNYTVTFADNCVLSDTILASGFPSGGLFPVATTLVTYEIQDLSGNSGGCSFTVTVQDTVKPTLVCPADSAVTAVGDIPAANVALASATDDCGVTVIHTGDANNGGLGCTSNPLYVDRTYQATDVSGNVTACVQRFTMALPSPSIDSISITYPNCTGYGSIQVHSSDASQYHIGGFHTLNNTTGIFHSLPSEFYTAWVVNTQNGCPSPIDTVDMYYTGTVQTHVVTHTSGPGLNDGVITFTSALNGTPPYQFSIDGGYNYSSNMTFPGLSPGVYDLVAKDANGCKSIVEKDTVMGELVLQTSVTPNNCNGESSATATVTPQGGSAPYTYQWLNTPSGVQTTATATGLTQGVYNVLVQDASGIYAGATAITVTDPTALSFSVTHTDETASGANDGTITFSNATGGNPGYGYAYQNFNSTTPVISVTPNFTGVPPGGYFVAIQDANGCFAFTTLTIQASTNKDADEEPVAVQLEEKEPMLEAYPNPFREATTIHYKLNRADRVKLEIVSTAGVTLKTLFEGEVEANEDYYANFEAIKTADGAYFVKLSGESGVVKYYKLVVLR